MFVKIRNEHVALGKKVYIFGASRLGRKLLEKLQSQNICVEAFLDNDRFKQLQRMQGVRVIAPDALQYEDKNSTAVIIASFNRHKEMREQIERYISSDNIYGIENMYMKYNESYERMMLPSCQKPEVSIILTVYNQWDYTYNCLTSFLKTKTDVPYEWIVGDNKSDDMTKEMEQTVSGAQVIHREENIGYLKNVNATAEMAKSKYILIMQNDTYFIQDYWLDRLVQYMEENPECGAAAPYMCGYDGEEGTGGCMIGGDGSVVPITGRKAQIPYSVMYIQPAAVLCRNEIWRTLKGYDEAYMPAWCEDEDFYMRLAEMGYDIVICPDVKYIHYGSKTCGVCPSGILEEHLEIFMDRWEKKLPIIKERITKRNQDRGLGELC